MEDIEGDLRGGGLEEICKNLARAEKTKNEELNVFLSANFSDYMRSIEAVRLTEEPLHVLRANLERNENSLKVAYTHITKFQEELNDSIKIRRTVITQHANLKTYRTVYISLENLAAHIYPILGGTHWHIYLSHKQTADHQSKPGIGEPINHSRTINQNFENLDENSRHSDQICDSESAPRLFKPLVDLLRDYTANAKESDDLDRIYEKIISGVQLCSTLEATAIGLGKINLFLSRGPARHLRGPLNCDVAQIRADLAGRISRLAGELIQEETYSGVQKTFDEENWAQSEGGDFSHNWLTETDKMEYCVEKPDLKLLPDLYCEANAITEAYAEFLYQLLLKSLKHLHTLAFGVTTQNNTPQMPNPSLIILIISLLHLQHMPKVRAAIRSELIGPIIEKASSGDSPSLVVFLKRLEVVCLCKTSPSRKVIDAIDSLRLEEKICPFSSDFSFPQYSAQFRIGIIPYIILPLCLQTIEEKFAAHFTPITPASFLGDYTATKRFIEKAEEEMTGSERRLWKSFGENFAQTNSAQNNSARNYLEVFEKNWRLQICWHMVQHNVTSRIDAALAENILADEAPKLWSGCEAVMSEIEYLLVDLPVTSWIPAALHLSHAILVRFVQILISNWGGDGELHRMACVLGNLNWVKSKIRGGENEIEKKIKKKIFPLDSTPPTLIPLITSYLSISFQFLTSTISAHVEKMSVFFVKNAEAHFEAVLAIPGMYRMVSRAPPQRCCPYVELLVEQFEVFHFVASQLTSAAQSAEWLFVSINGEATRFLAQVTELLTTVTHQEESFAKLRRRQLRNNSDNEDFNNIVLQLKMDCETFAARCSVCLGATPCPGLISLTQKIEEMDKIAKKESVLI